MDSFNLIINVIEVSRDLSVNLNLFRGFFVFNVGCTPELLFLALNNNVIGL